MGTHSELLVGILLCASSAALSNLGLIVVKSVVEIGRDDPILKVPTSPGGDLGGGGDVVVPTSSTTLRRPYFKSREPSFMEDVTTTRRTSLLVLSHANLKWCAGLIIFGIGQVLNVMSLAYLDQIVWAVVSLFSLVSNAFFSSVLLGEYLGTRDIFATGLIVVGSAMVVVSNQEAVAADADGEEVDGSWTVPAFFDHFSRPWFFRYCGLLGVILLGTVLHGVRSVGRGHTIHALTWTIFSAVNSSVSILLAKCLVQMTSIVANDPDGVHGVVASSLIYSPSTYVILAVFVVTLISGFVSLNMALAVGEALLVIPWITVSNTILSILGGMFYFEEFSSLQSAWRASLFFSGVVIAITGSFYIQRGRMVSVRRLSISSEDSDNDDGDDSDLLPNRLGKESFSYTDPKATESTPLVHFGGGTHMS